MNKTIIAIVVAVLVVLAVVIGFVLTTSKPSSTSSTTQMSTQTSITSQTRISTTAQQSVINLNLGILYPNDTAIIKTTKTITINKGGNYLFNMVNEQGVENDFDYFVLKMILSNSTMKKEIGLGWQILPYEQNYSTAHLLLSPGVYDLTLELLYYVNKNVVPASFGNVGVNMGNISLVSIDFAIQTHPTITQQTVSVKPIELNVSTEYCAPVSNLTTITVTNEKEYVFQIVNITELEKYFSSFDAVVTLSNSTEEIGIPLGFYYTSQQLSIQYNGSVYLSPGAYKLNVTFYYSVGNNVTPARFSSTVVEIGNTPLVYANFTILPVVTQIGTGTINSKGIAYLTLHSTGNVEIVSAYIPGTNISVNTASITNYQLTAGINTVTINFSSASSILQPGTTYTIVLVLSDGESVSVAVLVE